MNAILLVVTGICLVLTGFMSTIVWQVRRDERERSNARVRALSAAIYTNDDAARVGGPLFEEQASSPRRYGVAAVAGVFVVAALVGTVLLTARSSHRDASRAASVAAADAAAPLELLALEHDRDGDRLIVRGIVRNPVNGRERGGLSAVVVLFDRDGGFLASGRAAVPAAKLGAGAATPFVVTIPGAADVERFTLSFRIDNHVEPHVDLRDRRTP